MITGYSKWNLIPNALSFISLAHYSNVKFNETTFSISLSVCGRAQPLSNGKQVHGLLFKSGYQRLKFVGSALLYLYANSCQIEDGWKVFDELHQENELLWSLMLVGYVECNSMAEAQSFFSRMPRRGVVEWSTLISGYVKSEAGCKKALEVFKMMRENGEAVPNEFTLDSVVRGCGRMGDLWSGRAIHGLVIKFGFENDCSIGRALIALYSSCESMDDAKNVCGYTSSLLVTDLNELIRGLLKLGKMKEAELIFNNMAEKDFISYNQMMKGYGRCGRVGESERLFMQMPTKVLSSLNTMISVYARNGELDKALELFQKARLEGSPVSWNSMISGYIHNDQHENALQLYLTMSRSSISPTTSTFAVLFYACACLGSLQQGQLLHAHLAKTPFSSYVCAGTALVDMYSKCGSIANARVAFSCISSPSSAAWTALINGHAHHGLGSNAVTLFNLMLEKGVNPNTATFVAVLSACARAGLLSKGMRLFQSMKEQYGINPTKEHLTCVVELLGRSGLLQEAEELIQTTPIETDRVLLATLLHASLSWMDMELAKRVAQKMLDLDPNTPAAYVIMSNIYSRSGNWGQKLKVRDALKEQGFKKEPGCSWIEINNRSHVFHVNCRNHPNSDMIYATLESLKLNARSTFTSLLSLHN